MNMGSIGRSTDAVVCKLVVMHRAVLQRDVFAKRETDTLRYTAFDLPGSQHWINDASTFDNGNEIGDASHVLHRIDFNFSDVAGPGVARIRLAAICFIVPAD